MGGNKTEGVANMMHSRRMDVCEEYSDPIKGHNRDNKNKKKKTENKFSLKHLVAIQDLYSTYLLILLNEQKHEKF